MKRLLLCALLLLSQNFFSQEKMIKVFPKYPSLFKSIPTDIKESSPEWIKLMYSNNPNVNKIKSAYNEYYRKNLLKKSMHTQNYKYFMGNVYLNDYINSDGSIYKPTAEEENLRRKKIIGYQKKGIKGKASNSWTAIGPFETFDNGGTRKKSAQANVYAIDQSLSNPNVLIAATEPGAAYISLDKAENWTITSDELAIGNRKIGAVAIDPTTENTMYIAASNSLYKTIDKGTSWNQIHSVTDLNITDISINPTNPLEILTAGDLGLYKSSNGGTTWSQLLTGKCWDIERKTDDNSTVFVAKTNATNNVVEIYKTTNITLVNPVFIAKTTGYFSPTNATANTAGGARIAVTNADPNRLFVLLLGNDISYATDVNFLGVYRSDNAGETWSLPYDGNGDGAPDNNPGGPYSDTDWCLSCFGYGTTLTGTGSYDQGFYNAGIAISDTNPDLFLVGMLSMFKSEDAGKTFIPSGGYRCDGCGDEYRHPDIQEIEINGNDLWVATDGGVDLYDGTTFNFIESKNKGMNATEFWGFGQGWQEDIVVGGRYHNGNAVYRPSFTDGKFISVGGGESPTGYVNQTENSIVSFSDIDDKKVSYNFNEQPKNALINVSLYPNEASYDIGERSEIVQDPRFGNINYLGRDNKLWKTTNNGITYEVVKEFVTPAPGKISKVTDIEIPRSNPDYIYVIQYIEGDDGIKLDAKLWKSIDAGASWAEVSLPSASDYMDIQVAADNENEVYISFGQDRGNSKKVFSSLDGGTTWTNLTTPTLDRTVHHLIIQDGTDGGLYAVTYKEIYYRNNSSDWEVFGNGLPTRRHFNKIIPFYKENKLRGATYNRGIWESSLFEDSKPIAQPIVRENKIACARDTVYFEDYSILKYEGATWKWSFPGASYISSTSVRNPKVLYNTPGDYNVTLTVTDANLNTDTKTVVNMVNFSEDLCGSVVANLENALYTSPSGGYLKGEDFGLDNVTNFTMTAWIKPDVGAQQFFAGIFSSIDNSEGGNSLALNINNNELKIHYKGDQWQWYPQLFVNPGKWNHVAMVTTPTKITLYLNGVKAERTNSNSASFNMDNYYIGSHVGNPDRVFKGFIDELKIYNRALSEDEVKLQRHLILSDISDPNLQAYWQFNTLVNGNKIYDKKNSHDLIIHKYPTFLPSTAPVGVGTSEKITVTGGGVTDFSSTNLKINFNGSTPNGNVYVTRIEGKPDQEPATNPVENAYWVINNYGTNQAFDALTSLEFYNLKNIAEITASASLELHKRDSNDDLATWPAAAVATTTTVNSATKSILFNDPGITSFSQFYLGSSEVLSVPSEIVTDNEISVFPNPIKVGGILNFKNSNEPFIFTVFNISGKEVIKQEIKNSQLAIKNLATGVYFYRIEASQKITHGKLLISN